MWPHLLIIIYILFLLNLYFRWFNYLFLLSFYNCFSFGGLTTKWSNELQFLVTTAPYLLNPGCALCTWYTILSRFSFMMLLQIWRSFLQILLCSIVRFLTILFDNLGIPLLPLLANYFFINSQLWCTRARCRCKILRHYWFTTNPLIMTRLLIIKWGTAAILLECIILLIFIMNISGSWRSEMNVNRL